ncbi:protein Wnt-7b isoform X3 [Drosophila sechellia]|nr:protein Wnt-7b isoform X3 [Drosophila sechellia]
MEIYANQSRAMTAWRATSKGHEQQQLPQQQKQQQEAGSNSSSSNNLVATPATSRHCNLHLIVMIILACCTRWLYGLPDGRATCRSVPGLTKDQVELCYKASDVTAAALEGLDMAIRECQIQFQWHRWNCSSLSTKSRNPHASSLLKKGYRESAFAFAISAAGVAHSVARACSQGRLMSCGCDPTINRKTLNKNLRQSLDKEKKQFLQYLETNQILTPEEEKKYERSKIASRWKWGGCSHNMDFGVEYSKLFLDCREKAGDIQSKINLHNNHAGRIAVSNNMEFRCKCHGMSGSCQLKTCWKSAPDFHIVGKVLKHQFRKAILVDQSNLGNGEPVVVLKRARNKKSNGGSGSGSTSPDLDSTDASGGHDDRGTGDSETRRHDELGVERGTRQPSADKNAARMARKLETSLFYYQRSPNFCERDLGADIQGTVGRKCNRNTTTSDGCTSLCCGRGHSQVIQRRAERCHCKFQWCCNVECEECHVEEWISICN